MCSTPCRKQAPGMRLLRLRLLLRLLLLLLRLRRLPPNSRHGSRGSAACGRTRGANKPEALHFVISCSLCSVLAYVLADP